MGGVLLGMCGKACLVLERVSGCLVLEEDISAHERRENKAWYQSPGGQGDSHERSHHDIIKWLSSGR